MSGLLASDYVVFDVSPGHFFVAVGADIPVQAKMLLSYMSSTILGLRETRGGTGSLFLIFPCKDNFCPCYPCQRSKILVILARASGRGQKSWPGWYSGTFCLWK